MKLTVCFKLNLEIRMNWYNIVYHKNYMSVGMANIQISCVCLVGSKKMAFNFKKLFNAEGEIFHKVNIQKCLYCKKRK